MNGSPLRFACLLVAACSTSPPPSHDTAAPMGPLAPDRPEVEPPPPSPDLSCKAHHGRLSPVSAASSSAVVLGHVDGRLHAVIADADDRALRLVDVETMKEVDHLALEGRPEQMLALRDGRLATTLADRAQLLVVELGPRGLEPRCTRPTPVEPVGLTQSSDGETLAVASRWEPALTFFEGPNLAPSGSVDLDRDPYAAAFAPAGTSVVVSHLVGGRISRVGRDDREVQRIDASRDDFKAPSPAGRMLAPRPMDNVSFAQAALRGGGGVKAHRVATQAYAIAARPDGSFIIPASLADPSPAPGGGSGYGGGAMEGFDPHEGVTLVLTDDGVEVPPGTARGSHTACLLPRGAVWDEARKLTWVACLGDDHLFAYGAHDVARYGVRVEGGPTGLALDPASQRLVVWSQPAARLGVLPLPEKTALRRVDHDFMAQSFGTKLGRARSIRRLDTVELERRRPRDPEVELGRRLFHLAGPRRRIANDGRACASCHPDGRDDGLSWTTQEGPRQTPILAERLDGTGPFGWNGRNEEVDGHMQRTLERLRGTGLKREEREAIAAYLRTLELPHPEPTDDERVRRGRSLYASSEVGCASCHDLATATTDGRAHDLGALAPHDRVRVFDTPSLRSVASSAPYFHDGRYPTLAALLADPSHNMGHAADLSRDDRRALESYLLTL